MDIITLGLLSVESAADVALLALLCGTKDCAKHFQTLAKTTAKVRRSRIEV
jgi:hypothetical protein